MKLSKRIKCLVYLIYSYIVFLTICATVVLILGGYLLYQQLAYQSVLQTYAWLPVAIICGIAVVKYVICYFGWRATAGRNRCLISLFCTSLLFLIVIQIGLAAWALVFRQDLHLESRGYVYRSFNEFIDSGLITDQNHVWNRMQGSLRCCGAHGIADFSELSIPWSCYNRPEPGTAGRQILYDRGCLSVLVDVLKWQLLCVAFAAIGLCVLQVYGIFCTWHLVQLLKAAKKANSASTMQRQESRRERTIELLPFATAPQTTTSSPGTSSLGAISKTQMHENSFQSDLKRATAERMSRRQMSQKSQMMT